MNRGRHWDVFLAYASPDGARARVLYEALIAAGVSVCFDQEVIGPATIGTESSPATCGPRRSS